MNRDISLPGGGNFSDMYKRNINMIYRISLLHLKVQADAEDAVQSVFLKYLKASPSFKDYEHEKAWFITATKNHCRDVLKGWWHSKKKDSDIPEASTEFSYGSEGEITEQLMKLPEKYKDVLYLYYYEEYSIKEISAILKRNESTIRTQLCKGRERLKKRIDNREVHYEERTIY